MNTTITKFKHLEDTVLNYDDLITETTKSGRFYATPEGKKYPSVTTVLSILSEDSIREWRARVGEVEANKVSRRAASRGTTVHSMIEKYIKNEEISLEGVMPHIVYNFNTAKKYLDEFIGTVYALEVPLYSHHLRLAGRVDCIAEWNGKLSVIDFKTSNKTKTKDMIEGYFIQESAYAIMWEERTSVPIKQLVVCIAGDEGPQVFIEDRDNWTKELINTINEYKRRKLFGR